MSNGVGKVTIFVGPMFSGKSGRLITQANSAIRANKSVLAVKPEIDTRDEAEIVTRLHDPLNGEGTKRSFADVHLVSESEPDDLEQLLTDEKPDVFIADEVQFFAEWFVDFVSRLQLSGTTEIYLGGLDLDAWGNSFGHTHDLLALADRVEKLTADCFVDDCHRKANRTQLIDPEVADSSPVAVGGKEMYEARCSVCWAHPDELTEQTQD
jgi:thymidine kinase